MPASEQEERQINLIRQTSDDVEVFPDDWDSGTFEAEYLYRRNKLVVREDAVGPAIESSRGRGVDLNRDELVLEGAARLDVTTPDGWSLHQELEALQQELGEEAVGLDGLMFVCVHCCAAIEPERPGPSGRPVPAVQDGVQAGNAGSEHGVGVNVRVLDTGLVVTEPVHDWMQDVDGDPDTAVVQALAANHPLPQDGGHGTFTAGCVRVTAPKANVYVVNASQLIVSGEDMDELGAVFDSDLAALLQAQLVDEEVPDILVLNFAGTTPGDQPPVALTALFESRIRDLQEQLVIFCPAGNEGDDRVTWPAAFPWVEAVGALGANGRRASFSNDGSFVKVYAPGENLENAYAVGDYETLWTDPSETRTFDGLARWSGTSFSTPLVAGLVAARMSSLGQSSREAWDSLLAVARGQATLSAGPVLFPGQELA